jgi:hypothetical protein
MILGLVNGYETTFYPLPQRFSVVVRVPVPVREPAAAGPGRAGWTVEKNLLHYNFFCII